MASEMCIRMQYATGPTFKQVYVFGKLKGRKKIYINWRRKKEMHCILIYSRGEHGGHRGPFVPAEHYHGTEFLSSTTFSINSVFSIKIISNKRCCTSHSQPPPVNNVTKSTWSTVSKC